MSEFLRIARCTLLLTDFVPRAKKLFLRMTTQGSTKNRVLQQIKKAMLRHQGPFKIYPSLQHYYFSYNGKLIQIIFPPFILPIKLLMIYVYHYFFACPLDTNGSVASNSILHTCLQSTKKSYKKHYFLL